MGDMKYNSNNFYTSAKNLIASLLGSKKLNKLEIEELYTLFKVGDKDE